MVLWYQQEANYKTDPYSSLALIKIYFNYDTLLSKATLELDIQ